jgi:hypothetical protein
MKKQKTPKEKKFITVLDVIRDMGLEPTEELVMTPCPKVRFKIPRCRP